MYTYSIKGQVTFNDAETESGFATVTLDATIETDEMSAQAAKDKFFSENEQYDFFGNLQTCDQATGGKKGATFTDQNNDQTIDVELLGH